MTGAAILRPIDFHSHHIPSDWQPLLPRDLALAQRERWARINRRIADAGALMEAIDHGDLDGRVVNIPTALFTPPGETTPADTFRRVNDSVAEVTARAPGRLHGLASVDAFSGDEGAAELVRAVRRLGLRGAFIESAQGDLLLDAPEAKPTLAAASELGVPVFVHPVNPAALVRRMARYSETGILFARGQVNAASLIALIESGRLDEFPALPIIVTTLALGGILLEAAFNRNFLSGSTNVLQRQVYVDTMGFHPSLIRLSVEVLGIGHVLAGSDWPIVNDAPIAGRLVRALAAAGIDAAGSDLIAVGNARRLLGI
ncbi:MAG TPA: amidohydrolase family protein [Stellaceae bacterium]|nr:amidohydrolase family protein [Stellaceae bacterium]